jgi:hypothetical protein
MVLENEGISGGHNGAKELPRQIRAIRRLLLLAEDKFPPP